MSYIKYGKKELNHLMAVDEKLKNVIMEFGFIKRKTNPNLFKALVESIVGQQISTKAAATVKNKLKSLVIPLNPQTLLQFKDEDLQSCGLSFRKVGYLKDIANAFINKKINKEDLEKLSDELIIKELTKLKGVGSWTAKMLLIHCFIRYDIMSFNDLGLKNGLKILHNLDEITLDYFNHYKKLYSPYGTIASIYLWEVYNNSKT